MLSPSMRERAIRMRNLQRNLMAKKRFNPLQEPRKATISGSFE
jgi:hypothetical protein